MVPSKKAILQAITTFPGNMIFNKKKPSNIIKHSLEVLEKYFPNVSSWVEEAEVTYHDYGVPLFPVNQCNRAWKFLQQIKNRKGISFAGDYFSGGYAESAVWSAEQIALKLQSQI
jgi:protoporphyrinogen oxidase